MRTRGTTGAAVLAATAGGMICAAALPAMAQSDGRTVSCRVESAGTPVHSGKCRFHPDAGGSFTLQHASEGRALTGPILSVSVTVVRPGVAEVRGLTSAGINSRWGEARRSTTDRACWVGADFRVCAW